MRRPKMDHMSSQSSDDRKDRHRSSSNHNSQSRNGQDHDERLKQRNSTKLAPSRIFKFEFVPADLKSKLT